MQISSISSMPPIAASVSAAAAPRGAGSATAAATAPSSATATTPATPSSSGAASSGSVSHGSSGTPSGGSSAQAAVYSDTVGGKSYSGSVEESSGEYVASVPNLPGASASGASVQSAENNLNAVIDALV